MANERGVGMWSWGVCGGGRIFCEGGLQAAQTKIIMKRKTLDRLPGAYEIHNAVEIDN